MASLKSVTKPLRYLDVQAAVQMVLAKQEGQEGRLELLRATLSSQVEQVGMAMQLAAVEVVRQPVRQQQAGTDRMQLQPEEQVALRQREPDQVEQAAIPERMARTELNQAVAVAAVAMRRRQGPERSAES